MNAVEVYLLGRKLMKIAEGSFPSDKGNMALPASVRLVLVDISEHPDSSIGEITSRTGFPQSHVSASVARLRELGALETSVDASDGRRTLAKLAPAMRKRFATRAAVPVDGPLAAALGSAEPEELEHVKAALQELAQRLIPLALDRVQAMSGTNGQDG
jgi:DNA-binding MarR family transcriptional regulator